MSFSDPTRPVSTDPTTALPVQPATSVPDDAPVAGWAASPPSGAMLAAPPTATQWAPSAPPAAPAVTVNRRPRPWTVLFGLLVVAACVGVFVDGRDGQLGSTIGAPPLLWIGANLFVVGLVGTAIGFLRRRR